MKQLRGTDWLQYPPPSAASEAVDADKTGVAARAVVRSTERDARWMGNPPTKRSCSVCFETPHAFFLY